MKPLYTVSIEANGIPDGTGLEYDGVSLHMLRRDPRKWNLPREELTATGDHSYTMDFIERELFTQKEALSIFKTMQRVYGDDVKRLNLLLVELPVPSDIAASDAGGWGDTINCYSNEKWSGLEVTGFFDLGDYKPARRVEEFTFLPDGQVSQVNGKFYLSGKEMKGFVAAYQEAIETVEETIYIKAMKIEPPDPVDPDPF